MSDYKDMGRSRLIAEIQALSHWRDLALQFDNHRMEALWHLKRVLADENQTGLAEIFLSKPPLSASEIVAERDQLKAENESLRGTSEELLRSVDCHSVNHYKADLHEYDEPCKAMIRIKASINRSPENP